MEKGAAVCPSCGFTAYAQSAPAVAAFVVEDGRTLLGLRAHEPDAGRWDLLGGFLDEGEDPLDGLRRELLEETGLTVEPGDFVGVFVDTYGDQENAQSVLNLVWNASVVAGTAVPADDVSELGWFAPDALPPDEELAFRWLAAVLRRRAEKG
jgi:8-oxo-dGTP diphosphatase